MTIIDEVNKLIQNEKDKALAKEKATLSYVAWCNDALPNLTY